ncbi:hypothetical protein ACFO0N_21825 [Halobium salinum]|uniref:Transcriptional regulator n=1 Tax=Halobium salinum TaxID=1364940 RepID=A0ABD5PIQ8_9EURY|nr:hypothetical protein [Halobium salinum]
MDDELQRLREQHPKLYGALLSSLEEVLEGVESCSRPYPSGRQVRDAVQSPTTDVRNYGQALTSLVKLGIIDIYTERANSNRYDLTNTDYSRLRLLEECIAADLEG